MRWIFVALLLPAKHRIYAKSKHFSLHGSHNFSGMGFVYNLEYTH